MKLLVDQKFTIQPVDYAFQLTLLTPQWTEKKNELLCSWMEANKIFYW